MRIWEKGYPFPGPIPLTAPFFPQATSIWYKATMSCQILIIGQAKQMYYEIYNRNIRTALSGSASMAKVTSQFAATSSGEEL